MLLNSFPPTAYPLLHTPPHDMHLHTYPHSPDAHPRATVEAVIRRAQRRGAALIGLSNHRFPTTDFAIFPKLRQQVERLATKLTVLVGAEVCVLDQRGTVYLTASEAAQLDYVLAGPHHFKLRWVESPLRGDAAAFVEQQHNMLVEAAKNPLVDGLAHPWVINIQHAPERWGFTPADFLAAWHLDHWAELGAVARTHDTALEIGMGIHFMAQHQGSEFWERYVAGLRVARDAGAKFYLGSDAHQLSVVARFDWLRHALARLDSG